MTDVCDISQVGRCRPMAHSCLDSFSHMEHHCVALGDNRHPFRESGVARLLHRRSARGVPHRGEATGVRDRLQRPQGRPGGRDGQAVGASGFIGS